VTLDDALIRLDSLQSLVTGELLVLLNQLGYKPPPPVGRLVADLERAVWAAARRPERVTVEHARSAVAYVLRRVDELEGKSAKRVRRELSPLRRRLLYAAIAAQIAMAPAYTGAASEVGKSLARHQLQGLGLDAGQDASGDSTDSGQVPKAGAAGRSKERAAKKAPHERA
jgi:hypothetical protein